MERRNSPSSYSRREAIRIGAAALGFAALARVRPAFADDVISKAKIVSSPEMVSGAKFKKNGTFRIGFSNG